MREGEKEGRERETERQRDRETERQRDRETDRGEIEITFCKTYITTRITGRHFLLLFTLFEKKIIFNLI